MLLLTSILAYVIPDVPSGLQKEIRRERRLINHMIISTELDRARGRAVLSNVGNRQAAFNIAGSRDNSELCALMSNSGRN